MWLAVTVGWRVGVLATVGLLVVLVIPLLLFVFRDEPRDVGVAPYGESRDPARRAAQTALLARATPMGEIVRTRDFWLLAGGFGICGFTSNGLVGTHFIPAAHDHGMAPTAAAGLLALIGLFDIVGTIVPGWLTDRVDSRILLGVYYAGRGLSLLILPTLFNASAAPMVVFIVFYGLDWVATVPPTVALCREYWGDRGPVVFGWVFAPVAWSLGVPWRDAATVGNLLGTRMVLNEFIAFAELGPMRDTLDPRSFTIATFALCGFANFSSIGIQIGGIGALAPERRHDLARLGLRAMLAGTLANFITAIIVGFLL